MKTNKTFIALLICLLAYTGADYAALRFHLISKDQAIAGLHFLWFIMAVGLLWLCAYRKVLVLLLAACLTFEATAQTNAPFRLLTVEDAKANDPNFTMCEVAVGLLVIITGGIMVYKICTAQFWTNLPAPPPPATNPPAPPTNSVPPPVACLPVLALNSPPSSFPQLAAIHLSGVPDPWSPNGAPFSTYLWGPYPWQSSTNLRDWQQCQFRVWTSTNGCLSVILDGQGLVLVTNYTLRGSDFGSANYIPPLTNAQIGLGAKFFRWHE